MLITYTASNIIFCIRYVTTCISIGCVLLFVHFKMLITELLKILRIPFQSHEIWPDIFQLGEVILPFDLQSEIYKYWVLFSYFIVSLYRVQTQCFASVSPTGTLRIPGLASWTLVVLGFNVDSEYKLNNKTLMTEVMTITKHQKSIANSYVWLTGILQWVNLPWMFKHYTELGMCLLEKWGYVTKNFVLECSVFWW